jgi:hypothetical protein
MMLALIKDRRNYGRSFENFVSFATADLTEWTFLFTEQR